MNALPDSHNRLAAEFAQRVVGETIKAGGGSGDVMVVIESVILAGMLINAKAFGLSDDVACGLTEAAVQRAIERFCATNAKGAER